MDLTSSSANFIYAYKSGSMMSDSTSASIIQHDGQGTFQFDLAAATGGDGTVNPFTSTTSAASNTGMTSSLNSNNSTTNSTSNMGMGMGMGMGMAMAMGPATAGTAARGTGTAAKAMATAAGTVVATAGTAATARPEDGSRRENSGRPA
jgi:hypothetical protein